MDSAQIYKQIDIATSKPNKIEQAEIKHHLIDICDPKETYSVNQFIFDTTKLIKRIQDRNGTPLIVGGTMMYFNRLQNGMHKAPKISMDVRNQILTEGEKVGWMSMHKRLKNIDPHLATRISPADTQRITRGLEVWAGTGESLSDWIKRSKIAGSKFTPNFRFKVIALIPLDRSILHDKIAHRFHKMVKDGLIEEVTKLKSRPDLNPSLPSIRIVGVKQAWDYLENFGNKDDFIQKGIIATRQLAKRQLTWLRSFKNITKIGMEKIEMSHIISILRSS
tara:strand:+ start:4912 stop:5745 length:834 start_codon:yes stop_codon:yes gene_type:complete